MYQEEGSDFTITDNYLSVLAGMGATAGDVVNVDYIKGGVGIALSTYSAEILADLPAVYWRLGEASGSTAVDASGNSRDGTYDGSPTLGVSGLLVGDSDTAVTFAGGLDAAFINYAPWMNTADITVEALASTSSSSTINLWDRDDGSNRVFQMRLNAGLLEFFTIGGGSVAVTGSTAVNDGAPHHLAATYDGADMNVYVDGVLDGTTAAAGTIPQPTGGHLFLGRNNSSGPAQAWVGDVDEGAFYTSALSGARIAAHFAASGL
jgi:hypothetical protein